MSPYLYGGVLLFIVVGSIWLEFVVRTRVIRRWRRLLLSIIPVIILFMIWDILAIRAGHWWFNEDQLTGIVLPGSVPIEELIFFIVVPFAAILTIEAVRSVQRWPVGDEPEDTIWDGHRQVDQ